VGLDFPEWYDAGKVAIEKQNISYGTLLWTEFLLMGWVEAKRWADFKNPGSQVGGAAAAGAGQRDQGACGCGGVWLRGAREAQGPGGGRRCWVTPSSLLLGATHQRRPPPGAMRHAAGLAWSPSPQGRQRGWTAPPCTRCGSLRLLARR